MKLHTTELPIIELDGSRVHDLESFYDEVSRVMIPNTFWGRNLDAFNDILTGGFGTPEDGFVLWWVNAEHSKQALGPVFDTLVEIIRTYERADATGYRIVLELR